MVNRNRKDKPLSVKSTELEDLRREVTQILGYAPDYDGELIVPISKYDNDPLKLEDVVGRATLRILNRKHRERNPIG